MSNFPIGVVSAGVQLGVDAILVRPRRSIADFVAQVTLEETHNDDLEITDHPVEMGAVISDHAYKRPAEVIIKCVWSNSPARAGLLEGVVGGLGATVTGVQAIISGNAENQVRDVYDRLLKLQESRIPFDVYTGKRQYTNMLVRTLSVRTDKESEFALAVTAVLRQVLIVSTSTFTVIAPNDNQRDPGVTSPTANAGSKALVPAPRYQFVE